ncbi:TraG family conjugative transposon ATPase [Algoriphagus formosus]|uniref:TraG family conjugative transposon ATPase n=1 Tax=Algoriphagus formosus TaxID=2007308 RepID=A0A4R5VEV0_9BACT|nr:TraG family conjugative transposon ATPase [Algoriphagus aquimaris]TDK50843.1 TraG family conjugative transposon ATPase [Algoriphagus aquimaris]
MLKTRELSEVLPLLSYEDGFLISKQGDLTACFEMTLPPVFTQSKSDLEGRWQSLIKGFQLLPVGTLVWKQDWCIQKKWKEGNREILGFLDGKNSEFFQNRPYMDHRSYLFVTLPNRDKKLSPSSLSNLFRKHWVEDFIRESKHLETFTDALAQMKFLLESEGIAMRVLAEEELLGTERGLGLIEAYLMPAAKEDFPQLFDLEFKPDWKSGQQRLGLLSFASLDQLPNSLEASRVFESYSTDQSKFYSGNATPLGVSLDCNHIYSQVFQIQEKDKFFAGLESKRLRLQALSRYSRANELAASSIAEFLDESIQEGGIPVKAHANILIWAGRKEELQHQLRQAGAAASKLGLISKVETFGAAQLFWAGIPGNAAALPVNECFHCSLDQFLCLYNLEGVEDSGKNGLGLRLGERSYGKPIWVDLSDQPMEKGWITNRNKFILGPSGSGKSFFTNHMVRSYFEQGAHVVLIDVGHSYQGLCELLGGYYFTYSEENPICFNPFFLDGKVLDTEKKESLKTLLLALWKKENETFRRSEYVAVSNALKEYYGYLEEDQEIFPCFDSFYEFLREQYASQIQDEGVQVRDFDLKNFLYVLRPFFRGGEFDYLLNARENIHLLDQRMIVFELDKIKDHPILFPVVTLIIMEIFISKMRKLKGVRKMILIEEAWKAIAKEGMAEYIKYLFKTVRKFYGEAIVVTQEVDDIIQSPVIKDAIINNSDCKILLDQSKYQNKFEAIQGLLGLTDKEKALVLSINRANDPRRKYKEVFIGLGSHSQVYRTEVSLEEYLTYTTEEKEKMRLEELKHQLDGNLREAIEILAKEIRDN